MRSIGAVTHTIFLLPDHVHPKTSPSPSLLVLWLLCPDFFVIYYCLLFFPKVLISFNGSFDKCHTTAVDALIHYYCSVNPLLRLLIFSMAVKDVYVH